MTLLEVMAKNHLDKLKELEKGNINDMHEFLCAPGVAGLIEISKTIVGLYEIAESEREFCYRRGDHGIKDTTYSENENWKRSFLKKDGEIKVEHEYFLNLLYSISFSLYLSLKNYNEYEKSKDHLERLEFSLNTMENLYIALDTLAVLIYLVCGITFSGLREICFSELKGGLKDNPFKNNFKNFSIYHIGSKPLNLLNKIRNTRAHRPFLDWGALCEKIVKKPKDLMKVRSVCEVEGLFKEELSVFIEKCFKKVLSIVGDGLNGVLKTYEDRLGGNVQGQPHDAWINVLK